MGFPTRKHSKYIALRAKERIFRRPGLEYFDVVPGTSTDRHVYLVEVRNTGSYSVKRLEVPFEVVERCLDKGVDKELVDLLDVLLDQTYPT